MSALKLLRFALPSLLFASMLSASPRSDDLAALVRRYERDYAVVASAHARIPSFSRQTGLACSECHTTFPQLNAFGRTFKLNGYTLTDAQVVAAGDSGKRQTLRLDLIPPLSMMVQSSLTQVQAAAPGTQNGTVQFPQQLSVFFGGAITPRLGTFVQLTYDPRSGGIGMDNVDIRYVNHTQLAAKPLLYGVSLNNNPTVQDVWNTVPAWGFPFAASGVAPTPAAATLLDGALAQQVAGLGAYALWDNHLYGEVSAYRTALQGGPAPLDSTATNAISGVAPYWRAFYKRQVGEGSSLMVGTLGMSASLYPAGVAGLQNRFTDVAVDAQYERPIGSGLMTAHAIWIHENQKLDADFAAGAAANPTNTLQTLRIDASAYSASRIGLTVGFFSTTGTADALRYPTGVLNGSAGMPDSQGFVAELSALPWLNTRFEMQYVAYSKFNGATHNYDGFGRNASDNNTLYFLSWVTF
jgi:hypothetical protein